MTRKIINFVDMLKAVAQFFNEHPELLTDNPALQESVNKVKAYITNFDAIEKAQGESSSLVVTLKSETKTSLINNMLKVSAGLTAHATKTNDTALKLSVDYTEYELKKLRDHSLLQESRGLYELALPLIPELPIWKVTKDDVEAINTDSDAFESKDPAIKNIKSRTKQATDDMKAKQIEANTYLKDTLDVYMEPLRFTDATLYGHYTKARTIVNIAGGHSKAKAKTDTTSTTTSTETK